MPPRVEITGSDHFTYVVVRIENEVGTYVVLVEDDKLVVKKEKRAGINEIRLPEFDIVYKDGGWL